MDFQVILNKVKEHLIGEIYPYDKLVEATLNIPGTVS